jgi:CheY-like chemotaxis protein
MKHPEPFALSDTPTSLSDERTGTFRRKAHPDSPLSEVPLTLATPSEPRLRVRAEGVHSTPLPDVPRPPVAVRRRLLLAVASEEVTFALLPIIRALDAAVVQVADGAALERALRSRGHFDLVLSDARLPGGTGLGVLAGLRRAGHFTPFVIVQSIHQQLVRVAVGGGTTGVLSSRVVNELALVELVEELLGLYEAPSSVRRATKSEVAGS